jgi:hypothetical protein
MVKLSPGHSVDKFVPDFDLVFFASWLGWAVGLAGDEREEGESEREEIGDSHCN